MTAPIRSVGVRFESQGVPEVQAATRAVQRTATEANERVRASTRSGLEGAAESARQKWGIAGRQIATSMADIGRTGEVAGGSLKKIAIVGGEMAVMFSPMGPIASAVALLTLGLVSMFKRARDEQAETQKQFLRGLSEMGAAADFTSIQAQAGKLWKGTLNPTTMKFEGGVGDWSRQESALRQRASNPFDLGAPGALKTFYGQKVISPLDGKEITVQQLLTQYQQTITLMQTPLAAPGGPRSPITIGSGKSGGAAKGANDMALLDFAAQQRAIDAARQFQMDPATRAAGQAALNGGGAGLDLGKGLIPTPDELTKQLAETVKGIKIPTPQEIATTFHPVGDAIATGITESLQMGLRTGLAQALSGDFAGGVKAATSAVLQGLGDMFAQIAVKAMMMSKLMIAFRTWMTANPWAAAAIAVAMMAAAKAMGGRPGGGGGGGYSASASAASVASGSSGESVTRLLWGENSTTMAAGMTPRSATNVTIIGPNDASAQRAIQELLKNANRRG